MKLIIGLGNPGKKYEGMRHSVGQALASLVKLKIKSEKLKIINETGVFMNDSGKFVKRLVGRYKIPLDDLLIIHDDLDISLGDFRLQEGRGAAGHKGVESVIELLGANDFWRLRIGIGRPPEGVEPEEYVLGKFTLEEEQRIHSLVMSIIKEVEVWVKT